jgi:hypothetical protein
MLSFISNTSATRHECRCYQVSPGRPFACSHSPLTSLQRIRLHGLGISEITYPIRRGRNRVMGFECDKEETDPERWLVSICYMPTPVIGGIDTFRVTDLPGCWLDSQDKEADKETIITFSQIRYPISNMLRFQRKIAEPENSHYIDGQSHA